MVNELLLEKEKLIKLYQKSTKLIIVLVTFAVISAIALGKLFLDIWMGSDFAKISYILLVIHVLTFGVLAMNTIVWQIAESFKAAFFNAAATFAWMSISIPAMVMLSEHYSSPGVAAGRFIGVFVFVPLVLLVEYRFLNGIHWGFWASILARVAGAGAAAFAVETLASSFLPHGWTTFFVGLSAGAVAYFIVLFAFGTADAEDRQIFLQAFRRGTA